ncbi:recombinase family protein [Pseudomonas guariconensis]|uniref:recombinase family protein n=1 Tax=Pseudomonas guariconensis TaxID=1288410 RepID=UPI003467D532
MQPKAYSYVRFSTPEQARGDSKRRQYEAVIEYATNHGLDLVTDAEYRFLDAGVSAYKGSNATGAAASLKRFYDYVQEGKIAAGSYLLVESLDRLSREQLDLAVPRFLELLSLGINVVTLSDGSVYRKNPDMVKLIVSIIHMGRAHLESKIKGERVSKAWRNKQQQARNSKIPLGGACPQWLQYEGGVYNAIEHRVDVVKRIFELTIEGAGQRKIAKILNSENVPVFGTEGRNKSGLWGSSSVSKILQNRSVLGEYQPYVQEEGIRVIAGDPVINYYPAIIDESVFYAALSSRKTRNVSKSTKQTANFNVWSKLAVCAYCKSAMHLVNKGASPKGGKYLRCFRSAKGGCDAKQIRLDLSESVFKEILAKLESISLVRDNSRALRQNISEIEGRITAGETLLEEYSVIFKQAPSMMVASATAEKEKELSELREKREALLAELSSEMIYSKVDFFSRLDLVSYSGRRAANLHLHRLKTVVRMKIELKEVFFTVLIDGMPKFAFVVSEAGEIQFVPLNVASLRSALRQGDLDVTKFPVAPRRMLSAALSNGEHSEYQDQIDAEHEVFKVKTTPELIASLRASLKL